MNAKQEAKKIQENDLLTDKFSEKSRLNLNDLIRRRSEEKKVEKKTNIKIVSGAAILGAVVLLIISL